MPRGAHPGNALLDRSFTPASHGPLQIAAMASEQRVFLVTGGNRGLGAETVRALAARGHHVISAGRDREMAESGAREARALHPDAKVDVIDLDLASLDSVRRGAEAFLAMGLRLDGLIANAARYVPDGPRQLGEGGVEAHFATNHLGHFLLTELLLERLRASSPSRVVVLGSGLHKGMPGQPPVTIDFEDLAIERTPYVGVNAYARSKLANVLFAYELDRRERANGVNGNVVSPKVVPSTVVRHSKGFQRFLMQYVMPLLPIARTAAQAADNTVFAALDRSLQGIGGLYLEDRKPLRSSPASYDEATAKRLWEVSESLTRA